jgi:mono/diheme cytochrome c family protein
MSLFRALLLGFTLLAGMLTARAEISPAPPTAVESNPLVWDALEKHADLPAMTNLAYFTFWVTNTGSAEAVIYSTEASCECTVVEAQKILPWRLAPGEGGPLNVRLNTRGKFGLVTKTINIGSTHGSQVLTIHVKIPVSPAPANISMRQRDMMSAQADRQAVLRGSCAVCHAAPAAGHTGEKLFLLACGICHTAEHRAEMVPDLLALKHPTDADYWRQWITHGKAGSLMPAFAESEGGILNSNQIASLVEYLTKVPRATSPATTNVSATLPSRMSLLPN